MEGIWETVANWAASASGSGMLLGVAFTTLGILLAMFIKKKMWPLAILLAKFIWTKIGPLAIFLAKLVLKLSCALASMATKLVLQRIFQRPDVGLHERDGGTGPGTAQGVDV